MAKKTAARGKPAPATREIIDELVLSHRAGRVEMKAVWKTLNLLGEKLGEKISSLDSRVTGEVESLRERLKAGEKRCEPVEHLQEKVQSLAELVRGNSAGNKVLLNDILDQQVRTRDCAFSKIEALEERFFKLEDRLNDVLVQALKRIEELMDQKLDEKLDEPEPTPEPEELNPWIVLWRDNSTPLSAPPMAFKCRAVDGGHAEDKFRKAHPGGTPLFTTMAGDLEEAIHDWIQFLGSSDD